MVNFLIPTIACGCCFLMFLFLVVLSVIARVLGLGRKRKEAEVQAEVHSDEKGPVVDAEFKDVEGKGDERAKDVNPHDSHQP